MALTGCVGVHVVANEGGYSRDKSVESIRAIGGRYVTVTNDPLLCQMVLDVGAIPLYRVHTQDWNDDDADAHFDARVYARKLHAEAPRGAHLYIANEVGTNNPERLNTWTLNAVDEANKVGRKVVAFNWSYLNPPHSIWDNLEASAKALVAGGHFFGWHEGYDLTYNTLAKAYPEAIGRFRYCQQRFGGKHLITEFAASKTPHDGWKAWLTVEQWAALVRDAVRDVYAPHGAFVTPFTLFPWRRSFEYFDSPALQNSWAETNRLFPVKDIPVTQPIPKPTGEATPRKVTGFPPNVPFRNIRKQPKATDANSDVGDLRVGDTISVYFGTSIDDWLYVERGSDGVEGWVLFTGVLTTSPDPIGKRFSWSETEVNDLHAYIDTFISKGVPSDSGGGF